MFELKPQRETLARIIHVGRHNTGNVSATVSGKPVLSWNGTPTQKDDALKLFPVIQQRIMPGGIA